MPDEPKGLSEQVAANRLAQYGPNELPQAHQRTLWHIAGDAVREPMLQLLVGAGVIYLVLGDGERRRVAGRDVVVGDLLVLAEGDRVAADARLVGAHDLQTDESLLTGEAAPVRKVAATDQPAAGRPGGDDLPWAYSGSMVVRGQGMAEVTATGAASEIGRIGVALGLSLLVAVLYVWPRDDVLAAVLAGITLAMSMSMLPQEFPLILTVFMAMGA